MHVQQQQHHVCKYSCNELHMCENSLYFYMHMNSIPTVMADGGDGADGCASPC